MRLKVPEFIIDENNPFNNDLLNREPFAKSLTNLITRLNDSFVLAIDAPWGEGKTTFVRMWQAYLQSSERDIPCIYFDAFKHDYLDDPFIAIASEIIAFAEQVEVDEEKKIHEFKDKAAKVGAQLLPWVVKVGVKAATLGVIRETELEQLADIKDELAKGVSEISSDYVEEKLSNHKQEVQNIEDFKKLLSELSDKIGGEEKPLTIIIDELDRCKPTYALSLLERVKHLFSVEGVVFILVVNKEQLLESTRALYGNNIDADSYLQKFIDLECSLPKVNIGQYASDTDYYTFCRHMSNSLNLRGDVEEDYVAELARQFKLSLREVEKVYTYISLFQSLNLNHDRLHLTQVLAPFLATIKVKSPSVYKALKSRELSLREVRDRLSIEITDKTHYFLNRLDGDILPSFLLSQEEVKELSEDERKELQYAEYPDDFRRNLIPSICETLDLVVTR